MRAAMSFLTDALKVIAPNKKQLVATCLKATNLLVQRMEDSKRGDVMLC